MRGGGDSGIQRRFIFERRKDRRPWILDYKRRGQASRRQIECGHLLIPSTNECTQYSDRMGTCGRRNGSVVNRTKCDKVYKLYKTHEIVQSLHIVNFVANFTKIKFCKKYKKVKDSAKCPGWTNGTNRHEEQKGAEAKNLDELISVLQRATRGGGVGLRLRLTRLMASPRSCPLELNLRYNSLI